MFGAKSLSGSDRYRPILIDTRYRYRVSFRYPYRIDTRYRYRCIRRRSIGGNAVNCRFNGLYMHESPLGGVRSILLISQKPTGKMEGEVLW